jgi:hypothetical protein
MTARAALGAALVDLYRQSWRFFLLNAALSAFIVPVAIAGLWVPAVWLLLVGAGPLAAALMHCAVVTAVTEELRLADALVGLRLHWRRGLALGVVLAAAVFAGVHAIDFYAGQGALVLAAVATYLLLALGIFQLLLWPLAVYETDVPVRNVAAHALDALLRRPGQALVLGLALIVVNAAGLVAAVMPFLTLTIAYTFLAAARFVLPPSPVEEVPDTWPA